MPASPAVVQRVTAEAQKLRRYAEAIRHCHAIVSATHRHHRSGRQYAIHLEIGFPKHVIAIAHEPPAPARAARLLEPRKHLEAGAPAKDIHVVIRKAFDVARRRLQDQLRLLRGDVKRHALPAS